jgi:DNA-binding NarL/FixJ family response regulator
MGPVKIAVVSRDRLLCEGLCQILRGDPSFVVVRSEDGDHIEIDIRIVDVTGDAPFPGTGVYDASPPHIIAVNAPEDDAWAIDALNKGVRGILSAASGADELVKAIRVVHEGGLWAARRWLNAYVEKMSRADANADHDLARRLSRREREVFRYAATGMGNKELANRLAISEATVKVHLTRIFQKLGVSGRAELAAAYHGLRLPPTDPVVRRSA